MKRKKLYTYNPETDNFERFYPTITDRMRTIGIIALASITLAIIIYIIVARFYETPTVENLQARNKELRQQYNELDKRVTSSMKVMNAIQERDSNFYRVLLQMEPLPASDLNPNVLDFNKGIKMQDVRDRELVRLLSNKIDTLDRNLLHQAVSFNNIQKAIQNEQMKLARIPAVLPISIEDYTVGSGYGIRTDPIYKTQKFHAGIDMAADMGSNVFATADGSIEFADWKNGYGNCIDINHGNNYLTRYAHLQTVLVKPGQQVKRGELIGLVGSTGKSTGPHLHYEVRYKGEPQNPINFYFLDMTPEEYENMIEMAENAGHVMD